ncbi:MAG: hypothetical protein CVT60_04015 [Actinobacteria bacterium HGW-Actinobacteria-10]|nr:MAG: hypothetical protein CVT60_04015 [Actinobacteria bacterium HGW-Actinobacteria-10]
MSDGVSTGRQGAVSILVAELRRLRKHRQALSASNLDRAQLLVRALGDGDADVALERLISLADEHSEDRDIAAAMVSIGWDSSGTNVLDRLSEFGSLHDVDQRTVRRWSDAGINKLAVLLVGADPWLQPHAVLVLSRVGSRVQLQIELRVRPNLVMGRPVLSVDGRDIDVDLPVIERSSEEQRFRSPLADLAAMEDLPVGIDLLWRGEKPATYTAVLEGGEGLRLQATVRLGRLQCRLSLNDGRSLFD